MILQILGFYHQEEISNMDLRDLVKHCNHETKICLNLAVSTAVKYHCHEVCIEHLLIAINERHPQLIKLVQDFDLWLTPGMMNDIISRIRPQGSCSEVSPVLSSLLMDWLEVSTTFMHDSWGDNCLCPEALIYILLSRPTFSNHLHGSVILPPTQYELLDLERHLKKSYLLTASAIDCTSPSQQQSSTTLEQFTHSLTRAAEE